MKREHASVVLVFGGFVVLVLVFRGVWGHAWHALIGDKTAPGSGAAQGSAPAGVPAGFQLQPGSFSLEYPTPAASALPGSAPLPASGNGFSAGDFFRGNTQFTAAGYSRNDVLAAARAYAARHGYTVHNVAQEGHVEHTGSGDEVWIKYVDSHGLSTTEETPVGHSGGPSVRGQHNAGIPWAGGRAH